MEIGAAVALRGARTIKQTSESEREFILCKEIDEFACREILMLNGASRRGALAAAAAAALTTSALAADPRGDWLTADQEARIHIARCGGDALCGTIAALRDPLDPATGRLQTDVNNRNPRLRDRPLVGVQILVHMRRGRAPEQWVGHVYNADDGGTYPATLTMRDDRTLRLEGCLLPNALCNGQTWVRIR